MHTAQGGQPTGSLFYETGALVQINLTTYRCCYAGKGGTCMPSECGDCIAMKD